MCKLLPVLFLLAILPNYSQAQSPVITLDNLISFQDGNFEKVNETLLPKGWLYLNFNHVPPGVDIHGDSTSCLYRETMWVYDPSGSKANSFLAVYTVDAGFNCSNYVHYQTLNLAAYQAIKASVQKYQMRQVSSEARNEDNDALVETLYQGAKYQLTVTVTSSKDTYGKLKNSYSFTLATK